MNLKQHIVHAEYLQEAKKEYKNLKKQDMKDMLTETD